MAKQRSKVGNSFFLHVLASNYLSYSTFISSCLALRDLIVVYNSNEISNYLDKLWEISLRARDDIKVDYDITYMYNQGLMVNRVWSICMSIASANQIEHNKATIMVLHMTSAYRILVCRCHI